MKYIIKVSSVVLLFLVFGCQSGVETTDSGVKHYRQLKFSESPWDKFEGTHSISAEEAAELLSPGGGDKQAAETSGGLCQKSQDQENMRHTV